MNIQNHYLTNKTKKRNWGNKGSFRKKKKRFQDLFLQHYVFVLSLLLPEVKNAKLQWKYYGS